MMKLKTTGQDKLPDAVVEMMRRIPAQRYLNEVGRISVNFCKKYIAKNKVKPAKTQDDYSYKKGYTTRLFVTGRGKLSIAYKSTKRSVKVGTPVKYMAINRDRGYEFLFILSDDPVKAMAIDFKLKGAFYSL